MDSNGRHRPSASTSSTPVPGPTSSPAPTIASSSSTSTFRRLPSLARPFRRNPDKDKDKGKEREKEREREEAIEEDPVTHQRTLLSRVLGEPSSAATISAASVFQHNSTPSLSTSNPKRPDESTSIRTSTSPLPPTEASRLGSTLTPPVSPRKGSMQNAMSSALSPPIPVLSSQSIGDMEPITYPSHLAQRLPPEAGPSSVTSTPSPSSMSPAATGNGMSTPPVTVAWPRYTNKQREYTMGTPVRYNTANTNGRGDDTPNSVRQAHTPNGSIGMGEMMGPEPGPGGPPTGVPRRKESMMVQATEQARGNGPAQVHATGARDKESGTDTDSGGGENTRRRANTRTEIALGPPIGLYPNDKEKERGKEKDKEKENQPLSADKESHSRARKVSRPAKPPLPTPTYIARPSLPASRPMNRVAASPMYYSLLPYHGRPPPQPLRAHTGTIVGNKIWLVGGMDIKNCWGGVACYDTESLLWSTVETAGEAMPPLRAQTSTAVGTKLYLVCGGDGSHYTNETYVFDTESHRFSKPNIVTPREKFPPRRRAHTTVHYHNWLVVFGGGNGQTALNDIWALDISDPKRLTWEEWKTKGDPPARKGYHTANLVGDKMIVFGGSDGHASFADVHVLDLGSLIWTTVITEVKHNRLAHTSTRVGSYLFILGGHDGHCYTQDVLLFNLVTLQWESKIAQGQSPPGRGHHVTLLHDARLFVSGGYNGVTVFDDLWALDLGAAAYLPQVTTFEVDETRGMGRPGST